MNKPATTALVGLALALGSALVFAQDEKTTAKPAAKAPAPPATEKKAGDGDMKDLKTKASYCIGLGYGKNIKPQITNLELEVDAFLKGLRVSLAGGKSELTDAEVEETLQAFQKEAMKRREEKMAAEAAPELKAAAAKNKKDGEAYLAQNKAKPGVIVTKSGLQYKVVKEGKANGATPKPTDTVTVHYRGTLIDGKEFDSSYKKGQPYTTPVNRVIPGWTEALQLMKPGAKLQLVIPSDLAYGFSGFGQDIGPNMVLLFDIELIGIE